MKIYKIAQQSVLYHGSDSEEFSGPIRVGERDSGWFGSGFYLTAYPEYARRWGKNIFKVSLPNLKMAEVVVEGNFEKMNYIGDAKVADQKAGGLDAWVVNESKWSQDFSNALKQMGYDGIRVHMTSNKDLEVVIFDPSQVQILGKVE